MDENRNSQRRREGRARACEGLLRSSFGRRTTQAGAKAIDQLRQAHNPGINKIDWSWMALAAGLVLLIGGGLWLFSRVNPPALATLEVVSQGVKLDRDGAKLQANKGAEFQPGDLLETGRGDNATIRLGRQDLRINVSGAAQVKLLTLQPDLRVEVLRGRIEVVASTQPRNYPVVIVTPQAEAIVLGTHFFLTAKRTSTWLEVVNGWVSLRRTDDGMSAKVGPKTYAVVAPGVDIGARVEGERWQTPYSMVMKPSPKKNQS